MRILKCKCGNPKRKGFKQCRECFLNFYKNRTHKLCRGCKQDLSLDNFRKRMDGKRPRSRCKQCEADAQRNWRQSNPEEHKRRKKNWELKYPERAKRSSDRRRWRKMGLNPDIIEKYISINGINCNICGCPPGKRSHAIDHCHKSGQFRGVLCSNCNNGLGHFKDDPNLFDKAKIYLLKNKSSPNP